MRAHDCLPDDQPADFTPPHLTSPRLTSPFLTCLRFSAVKHDDPVHGWLGASPDGIIEALSLDTPAAGAAAAAAGLPPGVWGSVAQGAGPLAGPGRGILEIKCPYNRGQPELAVPPKHATWYYMPQVGWIYWQLMCPAGSQQHRMLGLDDSLSWP